MSTSDVEKATRAAYMREYNSDPEHRKKKRKRDRAYGAKHAAKARAKAKAHYYANKEAKQRYILEYQMRKKIKACEYLGGKCMRCGFDHPSALQFHHRDPAQKLFTLTSKELSMPRKYPWNTMILPELEKCDLLCSNCHFLTHAVLTPDYVRELQNETPKERDSHYRYQEVINE
jgi:hypothetical protein